MGGGGKDCENQPVMRDTISVDFDEYLTPRYDSFKHSVILYIGVTETSCARV